MTGGRLRPGCGRLAIGTAHGRQRNADGQAAEVHALTGGRLARTCGRVACRDRRDGLPSVRRTVDGVTACHRDGARLRALPGRGRHRRTACHRHGATIRDGAQAARDGTGAHGADGATDRRADGADAPQAAQGAQTAAARTAQAAEVHALTGGRLARTCGRVA